tara:strand:- start:228 stop:404 length:177 start_codon:yes stop_codon:yes gene_type:complete
MKITETFNDGHNIYIELSEEDINDITNNYSVFGHPKTSNDITLIIENNREEIEVKNEG